MTALAQVYGVADVEPYDLELLREQVRACMRAPITQHTSSMAQMHTDPRLSKGSTTLKKPAATYERDAIDEKGNHITVKTRKPDHDQWSTTVHATATRPSGVSKEVMAPGVFGRARYVRAIASLHRVHILSIRARYAPGRPLRDEARYQLALIVSQHYKDPVVRKRAIAMSILLLKNRASVPTMCKLFKMDPKAWRKSYHRTMLGALKSKLGMIDAESLLAWERECKKMS